MLATFRQHFVAFTAVGGAAVLAVMTGGPVARFAVHVAAHLAAVLAAVAAFLDAGDLGDSRLPVRRTCRSMTFALSVEAWLLVLAAIAAVCHTAQHGYWWWTGDAEAANRGWGPRHAPVEHGLGWTLVPFAAALAAAAYEIVGCRLALLSRTAKRDRAWARRSPDPAVAAASAAERARWRQLATHKGVWHVACALWSMTAGAF